jgi:F-type H+-transporting ATPase subunit delta
MAKITRPPSYAVTYARSLLELATEQNQAESVGEDLGSLRQVIQDNPTFGLFLADPAIGTTEREQAMQRIFAGKLSPLLNNFIGVLDAHGRLGGIAHIADAYDELLEEQLGKIEVDVTSAQKLTPEQVERVRQRVSQVLKKDAVVHQYVDPEIIGGLVIRVQDKLIDASVRTQLAALRERMLSAAAK